MNCQRGQAGGKDTPGGAVEKQKPFFPSIDCKVIPFDSLSQRSDLTFGMCDAGFCQGTINRPGISLSLYKVSRTEVVYVFVKDLDYLFKKKSRKDRSRKNKLGIPSYVHLYYLGKALKLGCLH